MAISGGEITQNTTYVKPLFDPGIGSHSETNMNFVYIVKYTLSARKSKTKDVQLLRHNPEGAFDSHRDALGE